MKSERKIFIVSNMASDIAEIQDCDDKECIRELLELYICRFNIEHYLITCLPMSDMPLQPVVLVNNWPKDWWNHYLQHNFAEHDPVIQECLRNDMILEWDENTPDYEGPADDLEKVHQIRRDADSFGLRRGFVVPIHRAYGFCGAVSYVGHAIEIGAEDKPFLHLMSIYAFENLYKLSQFDESVVMNLTSREKEMTQWAAQGKTTEQIANIVGITPRTVIMHLQNATQKLGASNRTHLVARALQFGQIKV